MNNDQLVLAVDLGTGGPKVGFVTTTGRIVWWEHTPVVTTLGAAGEAIQDPVEWWTAIGASVRRGIAAGVDGANVVAVAVTGQWASTVPVADDGQPVGPCLLWSDTRGAPYTQRRIGGPVQGYHPRALAIWLRRSGGIPSLSGADPLGHLLYLQHQDPELCRSARWFLEPVDYLTMRFTGRAAASHASMTAAWLTDNRDLTQLGYDPVLVSRSGVGVEKLPPLVPTGSVIGPILPEVAADLGINPAAVAITGLPDLHAAAAGSGGVGAGEPHLSIGTTAWLSLPVPRKKTDLIRMVASVPGLTNRDYLLGNNQESAGRCLQWYVDRLAGPATAPPYEEVLADAASVPAGAGGVVFTPWLTGERCPVDDRAARAGFHNLGEATTSAHLARAVLEGVAYNARWLLAACEHFVGHRLDGIRLVGGGARSDLWTQILADVLDREVVRVTDPFLAGLRGMSLLAAVALGELDRSQLRSRVPTDPPFRPGPDREVYARLAPELPKLYRAQRGFFRRINTAPVGRS